MLAICFRQRLCPNFEKNICNREPFSKRFNLAKVKAEKNAGRTQPATTTARGPDRIGRRHQGGNETGLSEMANSVII